MPPVVVVVVVFLNSLLHACCFHTLINVVFIHVNELVLSQQSSKHVVIFA